MEYSLKSVSISFVHISISDERKSDTFVEKISKPNNKKKASQGLSAQCWTIGRKQGGIKRGRRHVITVLKEG